MYTDHSYISTQKPAILLRSRSRKFGRFFRTILSVVKDAGRNLVDDTRKADKRDDGKDADPIREAGLGGGGFGASAEA